MDPRLESYEHFFVTARQKNEFSVECFRLIISDPLTYSPCRNGIFLLFMAAELYEIKTGCKTYLNVYMAPRDDILICHSGDLFLVDVFRTGQAMSNHKDFIYYDGSTLKATKDVPRQLAQMLQENLTEFIARGETSLPDAIQFP